MTTDCIQKSLFIAIFRFIILIGIGSSYSVLFSASPDIPKNEPLYTQYIVAECESSLASLKKTLNSLPPNSNKAKEIEFDLAICYFENGIFPESLKLLQKLELNDRYRYPSYLFESLIYFFKKDDKTSQLYLDQFFKQKNSLTGKAKYYQAWMQYVRGNKTQAKKLLDKFIDDPEKDTESNHYKNALRLLEKIEGKPNQAKQDQVYLILRKDQKYIDRANYYLDKYPNFSMESLYVHGSLGIESHLKSQRVFEYNIGKSGYRDIQTGFGTLFPSLILGVNQGKYEQYVGQFQFQFDQLWQWDDHSRITNPWLFSTEKLAFVTDLWNDSKIVIDRYEIGLFSRSNLQFQRGDGTTSLYHNQRELIPWVSVRYGNFFRTKLISQLQFTRNLFSALMTHRYRNIQIAQDIYLPQFATDIYLAIGKLWYTYNSSLYDKGGWFGDLVVEIVPIQHLYVRQSLKFIYESYTESRIRLGDSDVPKEIDLTVLKPQYTISTTYFLFEQWKFLLSAFVDNQMPLVSALDYASNSYGFEFKVSYGFPNINADRHISPDILYKRF